MFSIPDAKTNNQSTASVIQDPESSPGIDDPHQNTPMEVQELPSNPDQSLNLSCESRPRVVWCFWYPSCTFYHATSKNTKSKFSSSPTVTAYSVGQVEKTALFQKYQRHLSSSSLSNVSSVDGLYTSKINDVTGWRHSALIPSSIASLRSLICRHYKILKLIKTKKLKHPQIRSERQMKSTYEEQLKDYTK